MTALNLQRIFLFKLAAVIFCILNTNFCNAQSAFTSGTQLDPSQVSRLNACVQQTYNQLQANSETACSGAAHPHYFDAGNQDDNTYPIDYSLEKWPNYQYVAGSQSATIINGACTFDMNGTAIASSTHFLCVFHVAGCGFLKGGGNIRGYCSVRIHYIPQAADIIQIKEYCLASVLGQNAFKPGSFPGTCELP
jgi:hypothetical protein